MEKARTGGPVLVVDDDAATRELVCTALERVGYATREAASGPEAMGAIRESTPTVVVLDVRLPGLSGYEVCREIRDLFGAGVAVVFISGERTEPLDRVAGFLVGGDDYVPKPFDPEELVARIRRLADGSRSPDAGSGNGLLTRRERQVLGLLASGMTQKEIAVELVISAKTVGTHIQRILNKLDVHSRAQAVAVAHQRGLVQPRS